VENYLPNQKAMVPNYGEVWYNPNAVTNIFSLSNMEKKHCITNNSSKEQSFMVHLPNKTVKFSKSFNGLYYQKPKDNTNNNKDKTLLNHTIIPITTLTMNFVHVMTAGVDDNIKIAGVATNITNTNDINQSE
jgi:hypothetical protein